MCIMGQTILSQLKEEFDEKCREIVMYMVMRNMYEVNKLRYNELFREIEQTYKMSKPTFNEHLQHLIDKKLVTRKKNGKQEVHLYLNTKKLMIYNAKEMQEEIQKEASLLQAMKTNVFWADLPAALAHYFALCELRRTKFIVKYYQAPQKSKEYLLAATLQAVAEENEIVKLVAPLSHIEDATEKEALLKKIIESIDKSIEKTKTELSKYSTTFSNLQKAGGDYA